MKIIRKTDELENILHSVKDSRKSIGLVLTMGNIHNGHLSLIKKAQTDNDFVIATIFINPTQFNNKKDYNCYPQTLENDVVKLISAGLPRVDSIGHKILHANDIYINNILNNPNIPHDLQKTLILTSIKLAQYGDDMGSQLLQTYYNIVDFSL